jgi:hypothetical protein
LVVLKEFQLELSVDGIGITPKRGKAQIFTDVEPMFAAKLILAVARLP